MEKQNKSDSKSLNNTPFERKSLFEPTDWVNDGLEYYIIASVYMKAILNFISKVGRKVTSVFIGFSYISVASQDLDTEAMRTQGWGSSGLHRRQVHKIGCTMK